MEEAQKQLSAAEEFAAYAMDQIVVWGPRVAAALVTLIVGLWVIRVIMKNLKKRLDKGDKLDPSLVSFLNSFIGIVLRVMLFISVIGMVGIEATSFIAVLGAASLAVGLALQGTLQNFAGGVIILLLKPFKVGNFVSVNGYDGVVKKIQVFYTHLKTLDNKTVIIPNGALANSSLTNFSLEPMRRMDWTFGVAYGSDLEKVKEILKRLVEEEERFLKEPAPFVGVSALNDSSVDFVVRAWAEMPNYWGAYHAMFERVYKAFNEEGVGIPYPTMDVNVSQKG